MSFLFLPLLVLGLGAAAVAPPSAFAGPDPYVSALLQADEASRRGDLGAAARALSAIVPFYSQDYAIALALGRLQLRARAYVESEHAFRVAILRAPGASEARLGLGWALAREGRCDSASPEFRSLLDAGSYAESARIGLAACAPPSPGPWSLGAAWNQFFFPEHPIKSSAAGVIGSVSGVLADHWAVAAAYRFVQVQTNAASLTAPFTQNEGYAHFGYEAIAAGVALDGAVVEDGSGVYGTGTSFHVGASARWSPHGDLVLHGSVSVYRDVTVGRIAPKWKIPVVGPVSLIPGVALQIASGAAFPNASLTAIAEWPFLSLWAGGKWGEETRPAYLDQDVVYDIPERIELGAWGGARARLYRGLWIQASYSYDRLRRTDALNPHASDLHALAMGPSVNF